MLCPMSTKDCLGKSNKLNKVTITVFNEMLVDVKRYAKVKTMRVKLNRLNLSKLKEISANRAERLSFNK